MGVRYELRLTKKRSLRRSLVGSSRTDEQGNFWALREINLRVEPGESVAVIGPNGAGKSTLIKILSTLLLPSTGSASIFGLDVVTETARVRRIMNLSSSFDHRVVDGQHAAEFVQTLRGFLECPGTLFVE